MRAELWLGEAEIARLVDDPGRRAKGRQRLHEFQQIQAEAFPGCRPPACVIPLPHAGHLIRALGGMKRVKRVRSGCRAARVATTGRTLSIQGAGQGPSAEIIRCMSTQRWTLRSVSGKGSSASPIDSRSLRAIAAVATQGLQPQAMPPWPGQAPTMAIALSATK